MIEKTFALIKPDATKRNLVGAILAKAEAKGLTIRALRCLNLSRELTETLYGVHRGKDFFEAQVAYMLTGPVVAVVFEGENAIQTWRDVMGPTDFTKAAPGTIRREFALSYRENCVHGSDSAEAVTQESRLFFIHADLAS
jgi:nucleoside-diphosphate kinase